MSKVEDQVIAKIKERSEIGGKKYNTTMERTDFTIEDWLRYLQEELLDAAIYTEKLLIGDWREVKESHIKGLINKKIRDIDEGISDKYHSYEFSDFLTELKNEI